MKNYHDYINRYAALLDEARAIPLGNTELPMRPNRGHSSCALLFAPHPDDESIIGGLALRLLKEAGCRIINVAVTLGSLHTRRAARKAEIENACRYLGFELVHPLESGLEHINPAARGEGTGEWMDAVLRIRSLLRKYSPDLLIFPHANDWNSNHIGTHHLVMDALRESGLASCRLVETEYWHPMEEPNIMVESSPEDVAELVTAISFHLGEIERNPYHLALPSWLHDNVRRGAEHLGGQGGEAPAFHFATLYRIRQWRDCVLSRITPATPFISAQQNIQTLLSY